MMMLRSTALALLLFLFASPATAETYDGPVNAVLGDESWHMVHESAPTSADGEVERIRTHLNLVIDLLERSDTSALSAGQRNRRAAAIGHLRDYVEAGVFPRRRRDDGYPGRRPQFIDDRGVHCAVGELIKQSGHPDLARRIDATWEYAYVPEIESRELGRWAERHGFTARELAMIQPTYRPQTTAETVDADVKSYRDRATLACARKHEVQKKVTLTVSGDAGGNIEVGVAGEPTGFGTCFAEWLGSPLGGMKKVAAEPFEKKIAVEISTPAELAEERLKLVSFRSCRMTPGPRPETFRSRVKSGDGSFEASVQLKVDNPKLEKCMETEIARLLHPFTHGEWTFVVQEKHEMPPMVEEQFFNIALRSGAHTAGAICKGAPKKVTVKARLKKGARKVKIATDDGGAEFRKCFVSTVSDIATKSVLSPPGGDETFPSDADLEASYTFEP